MLERSIFELLKSKYGLGVPTGASHDTEPSLPMRVPLHPSGTDGVVDWPQYVKNRVASAGGSGSSPSRQRVYSVAGVVVNNADNVDVLPRARQNLRDSRRERDHQQAAARDRSVSPLRTRPHEAAMGMPSLCALPISSNAQDAPAASSLPAWCEQDEEMAELVRALHEKVYQRTVKEAQYDMLLSAQRR